ncbi:MAG: UDP-3-O-(3-hydroxymyristoyl)glucosamine N-acyltransferase, partial [Armatimonadaceae bacterium]
MSAPRIHPSAVIDPDAQLAPDVRVGPFAVIDAGVSLGS